MIDKDQIKSIWFSYILCFHREGKFLWLIVFVLQDLHYSTLGLLGPLEVVCFAWYCHTSTGGWRVKKTTVELQGIHKYFYQQGIYVPDWVSLVFYIWKSLINVWSKSITCLLFWLHLQFHIKLFFPQQSW